jgi:hypothetical protein
MGYLASFSARARADLKRLDDVGLTGPCRRIQLDDARASSTQL